MKTKPTIERIKSVLEYDSDTGVFFWKVKKANQQDYQRRVLSCLMYGGTK